MAYPNQHIDNEIPYGSRDHVYILDNIKNPFNLDTESTDKTDNIVNNVGRALVKKKFLILGSKKIVKIIDSDIYDT